MLIMTYAHARTTGDGEFIGSYVSIGSSVPVEMTDKIGQYDLLTSWADYLSNATLLIHDQCVVSVNDSYG